jgi:chromosome segregation protein
VFLKRLDIQGFKSFPQRVRVDFGPGITAVVGPNGSGKTNIVEAIRWVLGEQNMRHLRGDTLEDVIFTGSAQRKALGMAEVSLTMFNNRGVLPSEYTELTIARRTFRSGQSEYSINKNVCRLRDVRDLFLDTGMGSHAYSLIERGMVDNVLSDESGHRRFLFEEAAGIMRYKTRKKEALNKLDLTTTDLTRVSDVIGEIEREVRSLARHGGKARRYGRLRDEIKLLDLGLAKEEHDRLVSGTAALRRERLAVENRRAELAGGLARHEAELEELKLELLKREGEVRLAQEALAEREARGAALLNEVSVLKERRAGLVEKLEHARSESARLQASVEEVRHAAARLEEERARLEQIAKEKEAEELRLGTRLAEMGPVLDLAAAREAQGARHVAIVRLEQLYPLAVEEVLAAVRRFRGGVEVVWAQEEPSNMGAWNSIDAQLAPRLPGPLHLVARAPSASPAAGSATRHKLEQEQLVREALGEPVSRLARASSRAAFQER